MPVKTFRPLTPSRRYITVSSFEEITKSRPEKRLVQRRVKTGGRNAYGRVTARAIGGGHKQKIRIVDFKRDRHGIDAQVVAIEYDPIRSARLALLEYKDGVRRYMIAPDGLQVGATLRSGPDAPPELGNTLPLKSIPAGSFIHNLELVPGRGGQIARAAGGSALPGEIRESAVPGRGCANRGFPSRKDAPSRRVSSGVCEVVQYLSSDVSAPLRTFQHSPGEGA